MVDTARVWQILVALQVRLQQITMAGGYRTQAGADVRLEPSESAPSAPRITLYSGGEAATDGMANEREFTLVIEAVVPVTLDNAHQQVVAIVEDIQQALDGFVPMPGALPLRFAESLYMDKPDGVPAMVAQLMFVTRYRR